MIVLLGGSGYVGSEFVRNLEIRGVEYSSISRANGVDYYAVDQLVRELERLKASFVINAAGYTGKPNVDACEVYKDDCLMGNVILPSRVASACHKLGVPFGHVSSGCIYTGRRSDGFPFSEEDAPNFSFRQDNCSFYSGCKALGEELLSETENSYIWRLRIPFDEHDGSRNYLSKLMRYEKLLIAENSISHLWEFVDACIETYLRQIPFGTYNITNPGFVSTTEVVDLIKESGLSNKKYSFFSDIDEFMAKAAKTPRSNCVMSPDKIMSHGIKLRPVREAICSALENWVRE